MEMIGSGDGYGDGSGYGYGDGSGYGYGDGSGYGDGDGSGSGYGDGYGSGSCSGYGYGYGSGSGYGYGYGSGDGSGSGSGEPITNIGDLSVILFRDFDYIEIGCQMHSVDWWTANWKSIAKKEGVKISKSEVNEILVKLS